MMPSTGSQISPEIIQAYRETEFRILGEAPFILKVNQKSEVLADLHNLHGVNCSAFITAFNPHSRELEETENNQRQEDLRQELRDRGFSFIKGVGQHPSNNWAGEPSLLVLGISLLEASVLGDQLEQNAIVWAGADAIPKLILLR